MAWVKGPGNLKRVAVGARPRRPGAAAARPPKVSRHPLEGHAQPRAHPPKVMRSRGQSPAGHAQPWAIPRRSPGVPWRGTRSLGPVPRR